MSSENWIIINITISRLILFVLILHKILVSNLLMSKYFTIERPMHVTFFEVKWHYDRGLDACSWQPHELYYYLLDSALCSLSRENLTTVRGYAVNCRAILQVWKPPNFILDIITVYKTKWLYGDGDIKKKWKVVSYFRLSLVNQGRYAWEVRRVIFTRCLTSLTFELAE